MKLMSCSQKTEIALPGKTKVEKLPSGKNSFSAAGKIFLLLLSCFTFSFSYSQKVLILTKVKVTTYSDDDGKWNNWPSDWQVYPVDSKPRLKITALDNEGANFRVEFIIDGQSYSYAVTYDKYEDEKSRTDYSDGNGTTVAIEGSTLSSLYRNGWPNNSVSIFFWIKNKTAWLFQ